MNYAAAVSVLLLVVVNLLCPAKARANNDLVQATLICLITAKKPSTRDATFEHYGFLLEDDEWMDPSLNVAKKGPVNILYHNDKIDCFLDDFSLLMGRAGDYLIESIGPYHNIRGYDLTDCAQVVGIDVEGLPLDVFIMNPGTDLFCNPGDGTRYWVTKNSPRGG